jgi:hypothetical protein
MTVLEDFLPDAAKGIADRKCCRGDVAIDGTIRATGGTKCRTKIIDISVTGFRMECLTYILDGQTVFLSMPGLETLQATIKWQTEWMYGCQFARPLHLAVYEHIVRTYPSIKSQTAVSDGFMYGASAGLQWNQTR